MTSHIPLRPVWICAGCGRDWPCGTRQQELLVEYEGSRVSLNVFLTALYADAAGDMPHMRCGDLHERFFGWAQSSRYRHS